MLQWSELDQIIQQYFEEQHQTSYLISPFININKLVEIIKTRTNKPVIIITSWRKDHLLTGVSSLEIYNITKEHGWHLFINDRIHSKFYSKDLESGWIGSANLTRSGLSDGGNIEILFLVEVLDQDDRINVHKIISESTLVTDEIYIHFKAWIDEEEFVETPTPSSLPLPEKSVGQYFLTSDLPASESPTRLWEIANLPDIDLDDWGEREAMEHDVALYGVSPWQDKDTFFIELKIAFFSHPFIKALSDQITRDGLYFGRVKEWIQQNCTDVPVPYKRELTPHVQSIYKWFIELDDSRYEVDKPQHSELLRRVR